MTESPSTPSNRQVTLDLDDLYRQRLRLLGEIAGKTRELDGIDGLIRIVREHLGLPTDDAAKGSKSVPARRPTHRSMIKQVLIDAPEPMGVRELIDAVLERFDEEIPRTSLSPLLRKLANKGELVHVPKDAKWRIGNAEGEIVSFRGPKAPKRKVA